MLNAAKRILPAAFSLLLCVGVLTACAGEDPNALPPEGEAASSFDDSTAQDVPSPAADETAEPVPDDSAAESDQPPAPSAESLYEELGIREDFRPSFVHGEKNAEHQKYIMLHDTEGESDAASVIDWWDSNGNLVAAHFIVNKDGSVVQCAPLDAIVHHAGFGDTGHNALYGVEDESRDDKAGTVSIGDWASDYGMNSYSIGIEIVHVGGSGDYPEPQLEALDKLIAYIDAFFGFESQIIDHKEWRTGNSDTSPEFAAYLDSYKQSRTHDGQAS